VDVRLAVVGATGAVGALMRQVLTEQGFRPSLIRFLASEKSAGQTLTFQERTYTVEPVRAEAFQDIQIVLSSTPSSVSRTYSPLAAAAGAYVVDNSSAWRMDPECPLVVPEVNPESLQLAPKRIIANPNCVAIPLTVALKPLDRLARVRRVIVATYQSSSGKGATGLKDFEAQLKPWVVGEPVPAPQAHKAQLAGNVITLDWTLDSNDYTEEENKVTQETRKILSKPDMGVSATCVRVPVKIAHSMAINVEFERPLSVAEAKAALSVAPGVQLMDERTGQVPQPLLAAGTDATYVGRVRQDPSHPSALNLWIVADNLRKGAATNAVQCAVALVRHGLVKPRG